MSTQVPIPSFNGAVRHVQPSAPSPAVEPLAAFFPGGDELAARDAAHGSNVGSVNFDVLCSGELTD